MMNNRYKRFRFLFTSLLVLALAFSMTACGKSKGSQSGSAGKKDKQEEATKGPDNSVPITDLTVTAPTHLMRVGEEVQLDVKILPEDATNKKLTWSFSEADEYLEVSSDGILTAEPGAEKHDVTVTAKTTDGSKLEQSFTLRIFPEIDPEKPMVAITFDDGPNPSTTNVMLDALEENYAKATFFVLGSNAKEYPDVVKREYESGMEVGTHTYSHTQLTTLTGDALDKEVSDSVDAIEKADGAKPALMRPPYGSYNKEVLATVKEHGLCCVNWSLDTEDWKTKNADATYKMVMTAVDGDVVLLHDIHEYNVDAVKRFVPDLIEKGFQLVTVSEMYEARGETLDPGTVHFRTDPTTEKTEETTAVDQESTGTDPLLTDEEDSIQ